MTRTARAPPALRIARRCARRIALRTPARAFPALARRLSAFPARPRSIALRRAPIPETQHYPFDTTHPVAEAPLKLASLLAAAAFLAANPFRAGDNAGRSQYEQQDVRYLQHISHKASEPPVTPVVPGSLAPDFSYQTPDDEWHRLSDLLEQGPVLMLIGARDPQLAALEKERGRLLDLGVIPVAVIDGNARTARSATQRLDLSFTLIADPQSVIAGQFNAISQDTGAPAPCWFVIDRKRQVRALDRTGLPGEGYASIAIDALALPAAGIALPARR